MPARKRSAKPAPPAAPLHRFDVLHEVDTGGLIPAAALATGHPSDEHVTAYYAVAPSILTGLVERWLTVQRSMSTAETTFLDAGAGKGRAMLVASRLGFKAVDGIELNPGLAAIAEANIATWQQSHRADPTAAPLAPLAIVCEDALTAPLPDGPTVAFLFHPFEAPLLRRFLRRLERHFTRLQQPLDLLYVNAEHASVLDFHPAFKRLWFGRIPMSPEDHAADLAEIAMQQDYGSTGDEECGIYRLTGRQQVATDQPN